MGVLLDLIRDLIRKGPDTKILVYSQWMDSLSMLKVILESWRVNGLIRRENYINCLLMTRKHNYESTSVFRESKNMPSLESIPSMTSGSIMRLSLQLEDYQKGVFKQPEYCTLDGEWSDCSNKQSTRGARPILSQSGSRPQSSRTSDCCSH